MSKPTGNAALLAAAQKLMSTPAYQSARHPDNREVHRTVSKLFQAAYPEGSLHPKDPNFIAQERP